MSSPAANNEKLVLTSDGFVRENDRLDLLVNLHKHLYIRLVKRLVVVKQWLKLEKTKLLHAFGRVNAECLENNFNGQVQVLLHRVLIGIGSGTPAAKGRTSALAARCASLDVLLLAEQVAKVTEAVENDRGKHEALGLDLPVVVGATKLQDFLGDVHDALWVVLGDAHEDVQ